MRRVHGYHMEGRIGTQQEAIEYCKKLQTRADPAEQPVEVGTPNAPDAPGGLQLVQQQLNNGNARTLRDLAADPRNFATLVRYGAGVERLIQATLPEPPEWRDVTVTVYWGATGTGKSRRARYEGGGMNNVYVFRGMRFWERYLEREYECLLIDDFNGDVPIDQLLRVLDGHPLPLDIKFGQGAYARWTRVYITSNKCIDEWYPHAKPEHVRALKRRCKVVEEMSTPWTPPELSRATSVAALDLPESQPSSDVVPGEKSSS